jgi:HK97 gp10 family phage protein
MRLSGRGIPSTALAAIARGREVDDAVKAAAEAIRKEAARRVPKESGNLARNIAVEKVRAAGSSEYHVGWTKRDGFYGPLVELGTEDTPARPHLRPAADQFNNRR